MLPLKERGNNEDPHDSLPFKDLVPGMPLTQLWARVLRVGPLCQSIQQCRPLGFSAHQWANTQNSQPHGTLEGDRKFYKGLGRRNMLPRSPRRMYFVSSPILSFSVWQSCQACSVTSFSSMFSYGHVLPGFQPIIDKVHEPVLQLSLLLSCFISHFVSAMEKWQIQTPKSTLWVP